MGATEDSSARWRDRMLRGIASHFGIDSVWGVCQSPVENAMLMSLAVVGSEACDEVRFRPSGAEDVNAVVDVLTIEPQAPLGKYRADFLLTLRSRLLVNAGEPGDPEFVVAHRSLIVECDGHAFHEKTPEQAARDSSRDRDLQDDHGYAVYRFTGSEVYGDPFACAHQAVEALRTALRESH